MLEIVVSTYDERINCVIQGACVDADVVDDA